MDNKIFGYVRVSTKEQNIDRQIDKMIALGISERDLFIDKSSGANFEREEYQMMLRMLRAGDLIYIDALDRLGRNYDEVIKQWKYITRDKEADIVVLEQEALFDSRKFKQMGDIGKLLEDQFLSMMSYVADQERQKSKQRQKEGIEAARKRGKIIGRAPVEITPRFIEAYKRWQSGEITATQAMKEYNFKRTTFYKLAQKIKKEVDL